MSTFSGFEDRQIGNVFVRQVYHSGAWQLSCFVHDDRGECYLKTVTYYDYGPEESFELFKQLLLEYKLCDCDDGKDN